VSAAAVAARMIRAAPMRSASSTAAAALERFLRLPRLRNALGFDDGAVDCRDVFADVRQVGGFDLLDVSVAEVRSGTLPLCQGFVVDHRRSAMPRTRIPRVRGSHVLLSVIVMVLGTVLRRKGAADVVHGRTQSFREGLDVVFVIEVGVLPEGETNCARQVIRLHALGLACGDIPMKRDRGRLIDDFRDHRAAAQMAERERMPAAFVHVKRVQHAIRLEQTCRGTPRELLPREPDGDLPDYSPRDWLR
jgi:hypothetical protein